MPPVFIGIDTEGRPDEDNRHVGILLGCGRRSLVNDEGLGIWDVLSWLYDCYVEDQRTYPHRKLVYTGFGLTYDWAIWLRDLPPDKAHSLLTDAGRARRMPRSGTKRREPFPVDGLVAPDGTCWELEWLANRRLDLRPKPCGHPTYCQCQRDERSWMHIDDAFGFFGTSWLAVIDPANWPEAHRPCTPEMFARIQAGKANRGNTLDTVVDDEMVAYQQAELLTLESTMALYDGALASFGIKLKSDEWYGSGAIANRLMRLAGVPRLPDGDPKRRIDPSAYQLPDYPLMYWTMASETARAAFFGGWAEIMAHGHILGTTWRYDINSAYPHQHAQLPCLLHGQWSTKTYREYVPITELAPMEGRAVRLIVSAPRGVQGSDPYIGAMLHRRKDGTIYRPHVTGGAYWQHELEAAMRAKVVDTVSVWKTYTYTPCDCPPPMRVLADLYETRRGYVRDVGSQSIEAKAAKLILNSPYGKTAQRSGSAPFRNWVYASLITAGTRAAILDAIAVHPEGTKAVVAVATDSVTYLTKNTGLPNAYHDDPDNPKRLGEWTYVLVADLCQVKPGMYWDAAARKALLQGEAPPLKARGADAKAIAQHMLAVDDAFADMTDLRKWPTFEYTPEFAIRTARQAAAGQWVDCARVLTKPQLHKSDPRDGVKRTAPYWDGPIIRSEPAKHPVEDYSHTYAVATGRDDAVTPDGPLGLIVGGMLGVGDFA